MRLLCGAVNYKKITARTKYNFIEYVVGYPANRFTYSIGCNKM